LSPRLIPLVGGDVRTAVVDRGVVMGGEGFGVSELSPRLIPLAPKHEKITEQPISAVGVDSGRAWLTVLATFLSSAVTLGIIYSFGAFFESMALEFGTGKGPTAVIFGITTFTFFWLSLITGRLSDRFGPRPVLATGAFALLIGLMITSYVNSLVLGYFAYGAGAGIAGACAYIPMLAHVGGWFEKHRATAVGIAVAGIGVGTSLISPLSARLIALYGWRTTYRILGVAGFIILLVCTALIARAPGSAGGAPSRFREALRSRVFRRLWIAALFSGLALFVPFVFMVPYAKEQGISAVAAASLVGLLGGSSVISRIGFSYLCNRFGSFRIFQFGIGLCPLSFVIWLCAGSSFILMAIFMMVLGISYGCFVAVSTLVLADMFGVIGLGSIMGVFYTSQGLGGLFAPPIAGQLIDITGGYTVPVSVCVASGLLSFLILMTIPVNQQGSLGQEVVVTL
jgi:MFS family permease